MRLGGVPGSWIVHLAEGVRDGERERGDPFSSRHEFDVIRSLGLLTHATVIIHGTGLERTDFAAMHDAGAKLVWSPLSNLLLYGHTANVYDALAEGVNVALGTDWTPSGSPTLLDELKVADIALRDRRVLGRSRGEVPALAGDVALDRLLVDMVTRNAAAALRDAIGLRLKIFHQSERFYACDHPVTFFWRDQHAHCRGDPS